MFLIAWKIIPGQKSKKNVLKSLSMSASGWNSPPPGHPISKAQPTAISLVLSWHDRGFRAHQWPMSKGFKREMNLSRYFYSGFHAAGTELLLNER